MRPLLPLLVSMAVLVGCSGGGSEAPHSALLITLDTTRYDALHCLGGPAGASPNLDALAEEGVVYDAARTVTPLTLPSHASIMTGLYPLRHTVHANSLMALPDTATTLAERARDDGFQTAAFIAAVVLADGFGLDQGFDTYNQPTPPAVQQTLHYDRRRASEVADEAIAWLRERDPEKPFFVWVHFFDPHMPYEPPQRFIDQVGEAGYHAEVAAMDHAIGRIFEELKEDGAYDATTIVVVADHGEGRGQHDEETHGTFVYDSTIRVPMILRHADGHRAGERSDEIVSVTDVYPTLVESLGLGAASDVDGQSLFHRTVPDDRGVYFEAYYGFYSFGWSPLVGWADRDGKYLHSADPEFYVPERDAGERNDVIAERRGELARYRDGIDSLAAKPRLERSGDDQVAEAVIASLQKLGYTGAGGDADGLPHPLEDTGRPSPRSRNDAYRAQLYAQELNTSGKAAEAIPIFRRIVSENPHNHSAWFQLGGALISAGEYAESIAASEKALEVGHDWYGPHKNLGLAHDHLGNLDKAIEHYGRAVESAPGLTDILKRVIDLCDAAGRTDDANRFRVLLIQSREGG